jgi:hypothetical protein
MCDWKVCKYPDKPCYYEFYVNNLKGDTYKLVKKHKDQLDALELACEKAKTEEIVLTTGKK